MTEILLSALLTVFYAIQSILTLLSHVIRHAGGCYLTAGMGEDRLSTRFEKKVAVGFAVVIALACLVNLSLIPILGFATMFLFGCLIGLYLAFLDRPYTVPRD